MASIHHKAFADFVLTGKGSTHGALTMRGDKVFSYDMEIATVDRTHKIVGVNLRKVSRSTAAHQSAVTMGVAIHLASLGWKCAA